MFSIQAFKEAVRIKGFLAVYKDLYNQADQKEAENIFIKKTPWESLAAAASQAQSRLDLDPWIWEQVPLLGVPFGVKDNIDVKGLPTTAGCPDFSYEPQEDAHVVALLLKAGAVVFGKTNLDQFATGLVGLRSPYGFPLNPSNPDFIPGGSSSGSACAVSRGLVCFSLGTDTAGSGRVPACLQGLWGIKPTPGLLSTRGVVPACRSLDCVSIFASTPEDGALILDISQGFDPKDPYSRVFTSSPPKALPDLIITPRADQLDFFGEASGPELWNQALKDWKTKGVPIKEVDFTPFFDTAKLLYQGPWVAERTAYLEDFIKNHSSSVFPVTLKILEGGLNLRAIDTFRALWTLEELKRKITSLLPPGVAALTPTIGRAFTVEEVLQEPLARNTDLGKYTNYMNLAGLSALAYPSGFHPKTGIPFGVTLFSAGGNDLNLLNWASEQKKNEADLVIFVCGAHMEGLGLNHQLASRGGTLIQRVNTAGNYRMFLVEGPPVNRPALVKVATQGQSIPGELWRLPKGQWGTFLQGIAAPLGLGKVELENGTEVTGFIAEAQASQGTKDITQAGGWRRFLNNKAT